MASRDTPQGLTETDYDRPAKSPSTPSPPAAPLPPTSSYRDAAQQALLQHLCRDDLELLDRVNVKVSLDQVPGNEQVQKRGMDVSCWVIGQWGACQRQPGDEQVRREA